MTIAASLFRQKEKIFLTKVLQNFKILLHPFRLLSPFFGGVWGGLVFVFLHNNTSIVPTKTKCIAKCSVYGFVLCFVKGKIKFVI
jgi:hypothetical protein